MSFRNYSMTDAIISVVVEQLTSFVQQEVKLVLSVCKDVNSLKPTLQILQAVLRDAETRQIKEEAVRLWLGKLKAIVYDAEDVLDEWNTRNHYSLIHGFGDDDVHLHKKLIIAELGYYWYLYASNVVKLKHSLNTTLYLLILR
ncbi:hypothetical protein FRX31_013610 [Thalictrum thalictroides]|uniref:Disease resistance N-terminal domain-containing protein n=1 Tax=Thalictrum thalictroides TaxID=46969 RepID=A0A7J6WK13_THATH|nr:hypothetical protein FRX31_013610 [Thalictrum thalictroides]